MDSPEPKPGGVIESVKRVGDAVLALLQNRLRLLSVELQEEKYRVLQALLWLCAGMIFICLGLALGLGAVALLVHGWWGVPGLVGLALLVLLIGGVVLSIMWKRLKSDGPPLRATLEELRKDGQWLRGRR